MQPEVVPGLAHQRILCRLGSYLNHSIVSLISLFESPEKLQGTSHLTSQDDILRIHQCRLLQVDQGLLHLPLAPLDISNRGQGIGVILDLVPQGGKGIQGLVIVFPPPVVVITQSNLGIGKLGGNFQGPVRRFPGQDQTLFGVVFITVIHP